MSLIRRAKDWLIPRKPPSSRVQGAGGVAETRSFEDRGDGTLVMDRGGDLAVRLYKHESFRGGTDFSYFGYLGPLTLDLTGTGASLEKCVAVLVLEESPPNWADFLGAACRVGCMARISNMAGIGSELAIRLHFEELERPDSSMVFVISTSGGSFDPERSWVSLLISSRTLMVLPSLEGYENAFAADIGQDPGLREEMMKALI